MAIGKETTMYQLTKDGYTYADLYDELDELLEDTLPYSVTIADISLLSDWIKDGKYNTNTLIKLLHEMQQNEREELFWLSDAEYFIIPEEWTTETALACLRVFDPDSVYEIVYKQGGSLWN